MTVTSQEIWKAEESSFIWISLCVCLLSIYISANIKKVKNGKTHSSCYPILSRMSAGSEMFYYSVFIVVFQFGWAGVQISHLSLITDLTSMISVLMLALMMTSLRWRGHEDAADLGEVRVHGDLQPPGLHHNLDLLRVHRGHQSAGRPWGRGEIQVK